jgi:hypothetical protein
MAMYQQFQDDSTIMDRRMHFELIRKKNIHESPFEDHIHDQVNDQGSRCKGRDQGNDQVNCGCNR